MGDQLLHQDGNVTIEKHNDKALFTLEGEVDDFTFVIPLTEVEAMHEEDFEPGTIVFESEMLGLTIESLGESGFYIDTRLGPQVTLRHSAIESIVESL